MSERAPRRYTDGSISLEGGIDSGKIPSLIGKNQCAFAINTTFRQGFASCRPGFQQQAIALSNDLITGDNTQITADSITVTVDGGLALTGLFQCALPYVSDDGRNYIVLMLSGVVYLYDIQFKTITLLTTSQDLQNPNNIMDGWMVQAENFVVIQDGFSIPLIFDGSSLRRAAEDEIKTGRMMAYVNGRIWYSLPDSFSFRAGDIVYGDGTRASVLKETENTFLNEGGDFAIPSDSGGITAMAVPGNPDTALGQGPLLIMSPKYIFSINAPVDRTVWKNLNYPIQAISLVTNGALGSRSSITVNGDVFYRSPDGVRSFIIARRDFNTWGNTPMSNEVNRVLDTDTISLLDFSSAVVFDNRMIMTCQPNYSNQGVVHKALVVLDFDLLTGMREKLAPAWEGIWTGLNVLQLLKVQSPTEERCFAMCLNEDSNISIWEVSKDLKNDNPIGANVPIQWAIETRAFNFENPFGLKRLDSGDIFAEELDGIFENDFKVEFNVRYRPDQYPGWITWNNWDECAKTNLCGESLACIPMTNYKPQYRTKMRLPTPLDDCDDVIGTQYRNLYETQMRLEVRGYCRIKSVRVHAYDVQEPSVGECRTDQTTCNPLDVCDIDPLTYSSSNAS